MTESITVRINDYEFSLGDQQKLHILKRLQEAGIPVLLTPRNEFEVTKGKLTWYEDFAGNATIFVWRKESADGENKT